jgi:hypothetical protein
MTVADEVIRHILHCILQSAVGPRFYEISVLKIRTANKRANKLHKAPKTKFLFNFQKFSCDINCNSVMAVKISQNQISFFKFMNTEVIRTAKKKDAYIPGARSPWRLNFVRCCLILSAFQYEYCFMSPFWLLEF